MKIKKGDTVEVISGTEINKGKRGEVIRVMPKERRLVVQGVNMRKKHQSQVQTQGRTISPGIIEFEGSIDISNVMLVCPKCDEPTRVGIQREDGVATRVCKHCEALID
ncbi:MAG: 50S ribosomal protein L24 [Chloroflexota bacterium]|nr:MAG: 50S ribosomal protein L24 [Chloroflexota bacterium]UCF29599.1 MAG: 50S ribosomal protein L24 [Chloroflexota bacterium]